MFLGFCGVIAKQKKEKSKRAEFCCNFPLILTLSDQSYGKKFILYIYATILWSCKKNILDFSNILTGNILKPP